MPCFFPLFASDLISKWKREVQELMVRSQSESYNRRFLCIVVLAVQSMRRVQNLRRPSLNRLLRKRLRPTPMPCWLRSIYVIPSLKPAYLNPTRSKFRTLLYNDLKDIVGPMGISVACFLPSIWFIAIEAPGAHRGVGGRAKRRFQFFAERHHSQLPTTFPRHSLQPGEKPAIARRLAVWRAGKQKTRVDDSGRDDERWCPEGG